MFEMSLIRFSLRSENTNATIYAPDIEGEMSRDIKSRPKLEMIDLLECYVARLIRNS